MDLLLVRHAQPVRIEALGAAAEAAGPADPPLTPSGVEAATRTAAWLAVEGVDHIVTSPLRRAVETAAPLAERLGIETEVAPAMGEFDARDASYIPFEEMSRDHEKFTAMVSGDWTRVDGWADPDAFRRQAVDALEAVVAANPGRRVAVFTHAGIVNVYLGHVLGIERLLWFYPGYASISRVAASREGPRSVVSVNETAHLHPDRLDALREEPA